MKRLAVGTVNLVRSCAESFSVATDATNSRSGHAVNRNVEQWHTALHKPAIPKQLEFLLYDTHQLRLNSSNGLHECLLVKIGGRLLHLHVVVCRSGVHRHTRECVRRERLSVCSHKLCQVIRRNIITECSLVYKQR